ncbi:thioredoxin [Ornithinibacillus gellani]|uniref:thioredoxin family protein n=1 Tax=Ornithinibacillus gellani TaxID=2293253 RepID=UPI000F4A7C70|nr:thioredoxin domain-containing protein [Ornithinibacillus gellani]TQS71059.1 thioredoxin [Ornithinibacillus gellani]
MAEVKDINTENFQQEVIEENIPVIVKFTTEGCGPCQAIVPVLEEISEEFDGKLKIVSFHVTFDEGMNGTNEIAVKYDIMAYPTLLVFQDGEPVKTIIGAYTRDEIVGRLGDLV